jgi:hypothetical protein
MGNSEIQRKDLAAIVPGELTDDARAMYSRSVGTRKCDTTGGLTNVDACLEGAQLFDVVVGGEVVARYALKQIDRAHGTEIFIVAAVGGLPGVDLTASITPAIEKQCAAADYLTINTRRKGLVKKLSRQGWTIDAFVMRKKVNGQQ